MTEALEEERQWAWLLIVAGIAAVAGATWCFIAAIWADTSAREDNWAQTGGLVVLLGIVSIIIGAAWVDSVRQRKAKETP